MEIKAKEIELVDINSLVPHPKNNNKHPKEQIDRLVKILEYQGFRNPVTVQKGTNLIVCGHGRVEAAKKMGITQVPVIYQEFDSEAQLYAHLTADNAIAAWANLDLSEVNTEILDLGPEFDIDMLGIKDFVIEPVEKFEPQSDEDEVPEVEQPITRRGDIWLLGNHRLMCGDSTMIDDVEKLMNGEKADMVFTDPPYGISYQSNFSKKFDQLKNDDVVMDIRPTIEIARENICAIYVWTSHQVYHKWRGMFDDIYKSTIIWYKKFGGMGDLKAEYGHNYEICIYSTTDRIKFKGDRPKAVWEIGADNPDSYKHPTQKPVALAENAISHHAPNRVLDLFGGSGSTLIACEKTNRSSFNMELDEKYCDVIINRWQNYTGKKATLESAGQTYEELKDERL